MVTRNWKNWASVAGIGACVFLVDSAFAPSALAQTATALPTEGTTAAEPTAKVEEIVVTAQRRLENLQNVPLSVTAVTGVKLAQSGINSIVDLGVVTPGLEVGVVAGFTLTHIRGVGTTSQGAALENSVSTYVDGVYYASTSASIFTLNNIAQVAVLKGPQGTLFGRNATGGVIQVTTKSPSTNTGGSIDIGYGNYGTVTGNFYITGGKGALAVDLAGYFSHSSKGYGVNLFNGRPVYKADQDYALRSKWVFEPSALTKFRLIFDYNRTIGSQYSTIGAAPGTASVFAPVLNTGNRYDINQNVQPYNVNSGGGASVTLDQKIGTLNLESISAYRRNVLKTGFDVDLSPVFVANVPELRTKERQITEELQLQENKSGPLKWVVGLFYFNLDGSYDPSETAFAPFVSPFAITDVYSTQHVKSLAGFGQLTYALLPRTNLTFGARYTYEKRTFDAVFSGIPQGGTASVNLIAPIKGESTTAKKPSFRVALDHRFSDQALAYASYSTGFKSGGFNPGVPGAPPFRPETLTAYETGLKLDLLDRRVRLNASVYYYNYKDIQVQQATVGQAYYYNGASARLYGLDVEFAAAITPSLSLTGGFVVSSSKYTDFPNAIINTQLPTGGASATAGSATGKYLTYAPKTQASLSMTYKVPGSSGLSGDLAYSYNDGYFIQPDNILRQGAFFLLNASVSWESVRSRFRAKVWAKNLTDSAVATTLIPTALGTAVEYAPPRTYGATIGLKF